MITQIFEASVSYLMGVIKDILADLDHSKRFVGIKVYELLQPITSFPWISADLSEHRKFEIFPNGKISPPTYMYLYKISFFHLYIQLLQNERDKKRLFP